MISMSSSSSSIDYKKKKIETFKWLEVECILKTAFSLV